MDSELDRLIPAELHHLSATHWTPVEIAIRAVALLCPTNGMRILDIGAGVGKLCTVGALSARGLWCGIEQHGHLVTAARQLARMLRVEDRARFDHGDAFALDWSEYDALYLYNPFEAGPDHALKIAHVEQRLAELPRGVRVVTLHGFGGTMPASYELVYQERVPTVGHDLVLWVQRARGVS